MSAGLLGAPRARPPRCARPPPRDAPDRTRAAASRAGRRDGVPRNGRDRAAIARTRAQPPRRPPPDPAKRRSTAGRIRACSSRTRAVASRQLASVCGRAGRTCCSSISEQASARLPEGLQLRDGRLEVASAGRAQRERRLQGMVVVARERGEGRRALHGSRRAFRVPVGARDHHPQPLRGARSREVGRMDRQVAHQPTCASAPATRSAPSSASSEAAWWRAASTATMSSPRTTISSEIPRWKRRPPNAATGPAAGRSRARGRSRCTPHCAGRRCRHAPWLCIAPGGAPRRTRAATGARPRGTASGRGPGRPALGRDEVTQAEQGEPEGEHPVDAIIAACPWLAVSAVPISYRSGPAGAA